MKELVFPRLFLPICERFSSKTGFVDVTSDGVTYQATYAEHLNRVLRLADALRREIGLARTDRFGVLALNSHAFLELYHAALFGGGIINPLNIRFSSSELGYALKHSQTKVVFTDFLFRDLLERACNEQGITLEAIVLVGATPPGAAGEAATTEAATTEASPPASAAGKSTIDYEELLSRATPRLPSEPRETDPAVLMYTGGTTGLPKGALLDQRAEMLNAYHVGIEVGAVRDRRFLFCSPMFHAAMVAPALFIPCTGATSLTIPLFDARLVLDTIASQEVDSTVMVPVMLSLLLESPQFDVKSLRTLRTLVYGAAPMQPDLLARLLELLPHVDMYQGYGMTEASTIVTVLDPEDHRGGGSVLSSVGRPVFGVQVRSVDQTGHPVPPGTVGEICVRGGNLMREYWRDAAQTSRAFRGGWYHTGDVGFVDGSGYVFLTDRLTDMIVTGGENVYPTEVENAISSYPAVREVAVIGIPHEVWGEAVHAIVVLREGAAATASEIIEHARSKLSSFKVPKSIEFVPGPLPLSGAFKPLRRVLREQVRQRLSAAPPEPSTETAEGPSDVAAGPGA